jgi:hypothetical protein
MVDRNRGSERTMPTGGTGGGQSQSTTPGAKAQEQATQVKEQVQQTAADLKGQVTEQATGKLEEQKTAASGSLNTFANAVRQTADQLDEHDQSDLARYIHRAAGQVEHVADYLGRRDLRGLAQDAEQFARREPALFLGGVFTLGLFAARFLKSSGSANGGASSGQSMPMGGGTSRALPATSSYQPPVTMPNPLLSQAQPPVAPNARPSGLDTAPRTGGAPTSPTGRGDVGAGGLGTVPRTGGALAVDDDAIVGGPPISSDIVVGGPPREPGQEPRR